MDGWFLLSQKNRYPYTDYIKILIYIFLFRCNHKTGEWAHTTRLTRFPERKWLSHFSILNQNENEKQNVTIHDDQNGLNKTDDDNKKRKNDENDIDNNNNDNINGISATDNDNITTTTIPLPLPASVAIGLWHVRTPIELLNKIKKMALIEVDIIEGNHNPNGTNNKKQGKNNNKNKDKNGIVNARTTDGNDSVALSAFEDSRWFVMANDIDNQRDENDDVRPLLKGEKKVLFLSFTTICTCACVCVDMKNDIDDLTKKQKIEK